MPKSKKTKINVLLRTYREAIESKDEEKIQAAGDAIEFGREPAPGKEFIRNIMNGKLVEESKDTPYTCSVASETYWCS